MLDNALPTTEPVAAGPAVETIAVEGQTPPEAVEPELNEDGTPKAVEPEPKPEKTEAERERERLQKGIDRRTVQLTKARAEADFYRTELTRLQSGVNYQQPEADSEHLSLTQADFEKAVKAEALKLAPTLQSQAAETQRREKVLNEVFKGLGKDKFEQVQRDLNEAFGGDDSTNGFFDSRGQTKPAFDAIFDADSPAAVLEYLADPDNYDEAERISNLSALQAGRAIAKLEDKIKADGAKKPAVSKAPIPLDSLSRQGASSEAPDESKMTDAQWAKYQLEKRYPRK